MASNLNNFEENDTANMPHDVASPCYHSNEDYVNSGQISSLLFLICVMSFYIPLQIAYFSETHKVHEDACNWIMIFLYAIGTVTMTFILIKNKSWYEQDFIRYFQDTPRKQREHQPLLRPPSAAGEHQPLLEECQQASEPSQVPLQGIYFFGSSTILLCLAYIVITVKCLPYLIYSKYTYSDSIFIIRKCFQMVFLCAQMVFFRVFRRASFMNCSWFHFGFTLTMCANIISWMASIAKEIALTLGVTPLYSDRDWPDIPLRNDSVPSAGDVIWCYHQMIGDPPMSYIEGVLQPLSKEYNLLAITILLHYWVGLHSTRITAHSTRCHNRGDISGNTIGNTRENSEARTTCNTGGNVRYNTCRDTTVNTSNTIRRKAKDKIKDKTDNVNKTRIQNVSINTNEAEENLHQIPCKSEVKTVLWTILVTVLPALLATIILLSIFIKNHVQYFIQVLTLLIYKTAMLIVARIGKKYLCKTGQTSFKDFNGNEILLLISISGIFVLVSCNTLSAIDGIYYELSNHSTINTNTTSPNGNMSAYVSSYTLSAVDGIYYELSNHSTINYTTTTLPNGNMPAYVTLILFTFVDVAQVYLQTILILKLQRTVPIITNNQAIVALRRCFLYLAISNITDWLIHVFLSSHIKMYEVMYPSNIWYFKSSTIEIINIIFSPFASYYRFLSVILFYKAIMAFNQGHRLRVV